MARRADALSSGCVAKSELALWFALCDCERILIQQYIINREYRKIDAKNTMDMVHEPHMKKRDWW